MAADSQSIKVALPDADLDRIVWEYAATATAFAELGLTLDPTDPQEAQLIFGDPSEIAAEPKFCVVTGGHRQIWMLRFFTPIPTEEGQEISLGIIDDQAVNVLSEFSGWTADEQNQTWWYAWESEETLLIPVGLKTCERFRDLRDLIRKKQVNAVLVLAALADLLPAPDESLEPDQTVVIEFCWYINENNELSSGDLYHFVKGCISVAQRVQPGSRFQRHFEGEWRKRYRLSRNEGRRLVRSLNERGYFSPMARIPKADTLGPEICRDRHPYDIALRLIPRRLDPIDVERIAVAGEE